MRIEMNTNQNSNPVSNPDRRDSAVKDVQENEDIFLGRIKCEPLRTVRELEEWSPERAPCLPVPETFVAANHFFVGDANSSKVLLCHDMKGGYLEDDCFVGGSCNPNAFRFDHWSRIDIFCYFSHHFVTIPPLGWINAAHRNGVTVIGTLITESNEGCKICDELLENKEKIEMFTTKLAAICQHYEFDGWLVNIENGLNPSKVDLMVQFVAMLTSKTRHLRGSESIVLWYDAVTTSGKLVWQNKLNDLNKKFYEAADGIFLNYNWDRNGLRESVEEAKGRDRPASSVFVGIDCFGRGCFGGGGWDTFKAIDETKVADSSLSMAIFAPGWVHEVQCKDDESLFEDLDRKFWSLLKLPVRHYPKSLPFETTFCRGYSSAGRFQLGHKLSGAKWNNLSEQSVQPGNISLTHGHCSSDAFSGGGCLVLEPNQELEPVELELFRIPFSSDSNLLLSLIVKPATALNELSWVTVDKDGTKSTFKGEKLPCTKLYVKRRAKKVKLNAEDDWTTVNYSLKSSSKGKDCYFSSLLLKLNCKMFLGHLNVHSADTELESPSS